jgi:predicted small metal-binding protein
VNVVLECECGWVTRGHKDRVVEAVQVHKRLIHGTEITREEVLAKAKHA